MVHMIWIRLHTKNILPAEYCLVPEISFPILVQITGASEPAAQCT